jgi:hypothetical protein
MCRHFWCTGVLISPYPDQEGNKLQRQKILMFIYPIYNHNWRNISTITGLASNKIFSPSNKIHREIGRAKDLSAPLYWLRSMCGEITWHWDVQGGEGVIWEKLLPHIITERHISLCTRIIVCLLPSFSLSLLLALFHPVAYFNGVPDQACSRTSRHSSLLGNDPKPDTEGSTYTKLQNGLSFPGCTHFSFIIPFTVLFLYYLSFSCLLFTPLSLLISSLSYILYGNVSNESNVA